MSWTEKLKTVLRDPAWASIRAIIAFLALIASPFVLWYFGGQTPKPTTTSNKLLIYSHTTKNLTDLPAALAGKTRILVDGKDEKDVRLYEYFFEFQGDRPIRSADFETSIRGVVPAGRKILAVQQSRGSSRPLSRLGENGHFETKAEPAIDCDVRRIDESSFQVMPLLVNPNDWFKVEIYTATAAATDAKTANFVENKRPDSDPEITWSCRIAGVQCQPTQEYEIVFAHLPSGSSDPLDASISSYEGWSVYFLVLGTISNLTLMLGLSRRARVEIASPTIRMLLFAGAVFLSMATSEILADWWFHHNSLTRQPFYSNLLLLLDLATIVALAVIAIVKRQSPRAGSGTSIVT